MKTYLDCWIASARALFSQALAGEPELAEKALQGVAGAAAEGTGGDAAGLAYRAEISGDVSGHLTVLLDAGIVKTPLLGEGVDQAAAWAELLREVAESAAGEMLAAAEKNCRVESCRQASSGESWTREFLLTSPSYAWKIRVRDELRDGSDAARAAADAAGADSGPPSSATPGLQLLLDVELEATLRFGCCEMPLGEILELGPGDVVELDRDIADPVDLIVGDKIVARGEVVLVNGNFGLRVTDVATPRHRLESIRCLF
jgi:flagellar motor switch protein FliN/FliY